MTNNESQMKLTDLPFIPATEAERQAVWDACVREGRAARAFNKKLKDCPRYIDDDMTASWRIGWRIEDEQRKRMVR